jgi:hypothetical protein
MTPREPAAVAALSAVYSRVTGNVDFGVMMSQRFIFVGTGASADLIEKLARLGMKDVVLVDPDRVERKNLAAQAFTHADVGTSKVDALARRLRDVELEAGNPDVPALQVKALAADFLRVPEEELFVPGRPSILVMATDYHPAQARGNLLALAHDIPTFWVGIYRGGAASEIIFYHPGAGLPCYRCVTRSRYEAFERRARAGTAAPAASSGLPLSASLTDAILGHLILGAAHIGVEQNPHARLYRRLLRERRSFVQIQMDPEYRLGGIDIFAEISGPNCICFNTLFQEDAVDPRCPDCKELNS